jgi:ABC-type dipeptide/oligopeptide/nickel transport system permease subunit
VTLVATAEDMPRVASPLARAATAIRRNPTIFIGAVLLVALVAMTLAAPWIAGDPFRQAPVNRLRPPSEGFWFGTDQFGRDVFSRTVYGARVSLIVGFAVAALSSLIGLAVGLVCGYFRRVDAVIMRAMDGIMAIPSILLAIALITMTRPGSASSSPPSSSRRCRAWCGWCARWCCRSAPSPTSRARSPAARATPSCSCATSCPTRWRR